MNGEGELIVPKDRKTVTRKAGIWSMGKLVSVQTEREEAV